MNTTLIIAFILSLFVTAVMFPINVVIGIFFLFITIGILCLIIVDYKFEEKIYPCQWKGVYCTGDATVIDEGKRLCEGCYKWLNGKNQNNNSVPNHITNETLLQLKAIVVLEAMRVIAIIMLTLQKNPDSFFSVEQLKNAVLERDINMDDEATLAICHMLYNENFIGKIDDDDSFTSK